MTQSVILSVEKLKVSFDSFIAVNEVSFQLQKGKTLAIVGESGSGKSVIALSAMGLLPGYAKQAGTIRLYTNDEEYTISSLGNKKVMQQLRGSEISMVFQEPMSSLNPVMKVGKQLAESIKLHQHISTPQAKNIAIDWLNKVKINDAVSVYKRYPHQLSGGQKQRVMIAMAMCNNPDVLIADEPTTALDVTVQKDIVELMRQLQQDYGTAMIFITHDLALASQIADDVLVMYQGNVVEQGIMEQVLYQPQKDYTKALLSCRPSGKQKGQRLPVVNDFIQGRDVSTQKFADTLTDQPLLQVKNVKVWFEKSKSLFSKNVDYFKAVNDVSFQLYKGEVLGLVGESGCGKSTLSKSIMGLAPLSGGQVVYKGIDIASASKAEWKKLRKDIQLIFQDPFASLNPRMTVGEMLREPLAIHKIVPPKQIQSEIERLLDIVQLPASSKHKYPHQFSGGQRQRIGIARALSVRPDLLLCDESVSALDVSVQAQVLNLLKDLQVELGLSYLFISHDLNVVHYISDRIMVMNKGVLVESGNANGVMQQPKDNYTKKLISAIPEYNI